MSRPTPGIRPSLRARVLSRVHAGLFLDVSFTAGDEIVVLFGPSGAGKTTLLSLIAGLRSPDEGRVALGDCTLFDSDRGIELPLRRRGIGMIFQHHRLFPHLNVAHNIAFGLSRWRAADIGARVAELAERCGVSHLLDRWPSTLSGGERQRVGLARALAPRPRLLLCDEPFSALDLASRVTLGETLRTLRESEGVPVLFVTHSPAEAVTLGDRMLLIEGGRVVDGGPPLDVLASWRPGGHGSPMDGPSLDLRNVSRATVVGPTPDGLATIVRLADGPDLILAGRCRAPGSPVLVMVRADDILLARGVPGSDVLSARNILPARVESLLPHGQEVEVVASTGGVRWVVSLIAPAVAALSLSRGENVSLVIKARSCHLLDDRSAVADDGMGESVA